MKLITYKPFAFLLNSSAGNRTSIIFGVINTFLLFLNALIVANKNQQKSIGFNFDKLRFTNSSKTSQYILVGKDKSVVTLDNLCGPTSYIEVC